MVGTRAQSQHVHSILDDAGTSTLDALTGWYTLNMFMGWWGPWGHMYTYALDSMRYSYSVVCNT